jgi:hypothetical protein
VKIKDAVEAVVEAIRLAERVELVGSQVGEIARTAREDSRELREQVGSLRERVARLEALIK